MKHQTLPAEASRRSRFKLAWMVITFLFNAVLVVWISCTVLIVAGILIMALWLAYHGEPWPSNDHPNPLLFAAGAAAYLLWIAFNVWRDWKKSYK